MEILFRISIFEFRVCILLMPEQDSVKSLMNSRVISVLPDTPIIVAIDILLTNNFNGVPVVDKAGVIVGILTKYDIIINRSSVRDDTKVKDLMNNDPLVLVENMTVDDAVKAFSEHHKVDPIPVVDMTRRVIGVISRYDMVKMFREYGTVFTVKNQKPIQRSGNNGVWFFVALVVFLSIAAAAYYLGFLDSFLR